MSLKTLLNNVPYPAGTMEKTVRTIEGYGCSSKQMAKKALIMRAFNIMNYSTAIESAAEKRDIKALTEFKLRLNGSLDLYCLQ